MCILANELYNRRAYSSEMYQCFRDVSKDVGRVFPFRSFFTFLRQKNEWELNATPNRPFSSTAYETGNDQERRHTQTASSLGEEYGVDVASMGSGSKVGGESSNPDIVTGNDALCSIQTGTPVSGSRIVSTSREGVVSTGEHAVPERSLSSKRALKISSQSHALDNGARAIKELERASKRRK